MAMSSALVTSAAVWELSMDQPTTRRAQVPSATAQCTLPSRAGCSAMSVTRSLSGAARLNWRCTRSPAVGGLVPGPRAAVSGQAFDPGAAHEQVDRPVADGDAQAGGKLGVHPADPYVPREAWCTAWICSVSHACRTARFDGAQLLPVPGIDALRADIQGVRDLRDRPASLDKIEYFPELSRVPPGHNVLRGLLDGDHPATRLRRTRGNISPGIPA
jgi:hypothetical protein